MLILARSTYRKILGSGCNQQHQPEHNPKIQQCLPSILKCATASSYPTGDKGRRVLRALLIECELFSGPPYKDRYLLL